MAKVNVVKKAQKDQGKCGRCGVEIKRGDPYKHWGFMRQPKKIRCMKPECAPKRSELTQSEYYGRNADIEDGFEEALASATCKEDIVAALNASAEEVRELGEEQEEKRSNMPDALQDSDTGQMLEARKEACDNLADEMESLAGQIEGDSDFDELDPESIDDQNEAIEAQGIEREAGMSDDDWETEKKKAVKTENEDRLNRAREEAAVDWSWE